MEFVLKYLYGFPSSCSFFNKRLNYSMEVEMQTQSRRILNISRVVLRKENQCNPHHVEMKAYGSSKKR